MQSPLDETPDLARLARVRLLALDVDGTLTDGRIRVAESGESLDFCVLDGIALLWLREVGIEVAWITGRDTPALRRRARDLRIAELHALVQDKASCLRALQARLRIAPAETAAMGDDIPDLGLAAAAGIFACPHDARPEVRARAHICTSARGGEGAVRELSEHLLRARGAWERILARAAGEPSGESS